MARNDLPVAVVLAGGLARRMGGGDKPLLMLAGQTLLDHALDRVRPQSHAQVLNANGDPTRFAAWGLPVVADTVPGFPGPLAGILAAMRWAQAQHPETEYLLSVPGDTPFLPRDLGARLDAARREAGTPIACAASEGRVHPVIGLWRVTLADALEAALRGGHHKVGDFAAAHGLAEASFVGDPFFNVNTPDDLARAEAIIRKQ